MITLGSRVGGYTVVHLLGQGGTGQVYLAQHHRIARRAAIKVLLPELSANESVVERFFTEARATSLIRHPGIVEILDCDMRDGQAYVVMEHLEGESLADYLGRAGGLVGDVPFALAVVSQVARAVGAAHDAGIVHRDLKPRNVFLSVSSADGRIVAKVLDFGIAKLAERGAATPTGTGTPVYMSPEQWRDGSKAVDGRSDVYSLGCILYEMVCAVPPFVRENMDNLIVAHVSEAPAPPHTHVPSILPALDRLLMQMLAKTPADRPQTMEAVAGELATCLAALGTRAPLSDVRPRKPVVIPVLPAPPDQAAVHSTTTDTPSSTIRNVVGKKAEPIVPRRSSFARATMMLIAVLVIGGVGALVALRGQIFASATTAEPDPPSAALEPQTPPPPAMPDKVTVDVRGLPPGAQVFVDGAATGAISGGL